VKIPKISTFNEIHYALCRKIHSNSRVSLSLMQSFLALHKKWDYSLLGYNAM
jgi:hypothetical protein